MVEYLKVTAGLECCKDSEGALCNMCPYDDGKVFSAGCISSLMSDALELLQEAEEWLI